MKVVRYNEAVRLFLTYCKAKGLAPKTLQTYEASLEKLQNFMASNEIEPTLPGVEILRSFVAALLDQGMARTSIAIYMRSVHCFYNFLAREEIIEATPMARVEIPKVPMQYPEVLTEAQMKALLKACPRNTITGIRNYAIVLTFIDTGIRLSELVNLDLEDTDLRSRTIRIRNGKGGKERQVFMGRKLFHALRKWLDVRGFSLPSEALFVSSRSGDRLDKRNVARILERLGKKAGLSQVHPHLLRHTFATHYIMNGGDPFTLQRLLGHSSIKTTMIYVNMAGTSLRENHAKASPGDRL